MSMATCWTWAASAAISVVSRLRAGPTPRYFLISVVSRLRACPTPRYFLISVVSRLRAGPTPRYFLISVVSRLRACPTPRYFLIPVVAPLKHTVEAMMPRRVGSGVPTSGGVISARATPSAFSFGCDSERWRFRLIGFRGFAPRLAQCWLSRYAMRAGPGFGSGFGPGPGTGRFRLRTCCRCRCRGRCRGRCCCRSAAGFQAFGGKAWLTADR